MNDFKFLLDDMLLSRVEPGIIAVAVITLVIIISAVIFSAIELKKQKGDTDAEPTAVHDGGMPDSDDTH